MSEGDVIFLEEPGVLSSLPRPIGDYISQQISVYEFDEGIGDYEYWGVKGRDVCIVPQCDDPSGELEIVWTQDVAPDLEDVVIANSFQDSYGEVKYKVAISKHISKNVRYVEDADDFIGEEIPVDVEVAYEITELTVRVMQKESANTYWCRARVSWEISSIDWR